MTSAMYLYPGGTFSKRSLTATTVTMAVAAMRMAVTMVSSPRVRRRKYGEMHKWSTFDATPRDSPKAT